MSYQLKNGRYEYLKCKATKCGVSVCTNTNSIRFDAVFEAVEMEVKKLLINNYNPAKINKNSLIYNDKKTDLYQNYEKQERKVSELKSKLEELSKVRIETEEYKNVRKHLLANLEGDLAWRYDKSTYECLKKKQRTDDVRSR